MYTGQVNNMANWRYHGRAKIDAYNPKAVAVCDKCQFKYNRIDLVWQQEYRGNNLMKTGFLVCKTCLDVPYQGRRPIIIPADPVPILNPRTEPLLLEENSTAPSNTLNNFLKPSNRMGIRICNIAI